MNFSLAGQSSLQKYMPDTPECENNPETDGWIRRFTACEPRLSEAVELYKESGFEVLLVPLPAKTTADNCIKIREEKECMECYRGVEEKYRIIYTKSKMPPS